MWPGYQQMHDAGHGRPAADGAQPRTVRRDGDSDSVRHRRRRSGPGPTAGTNSMSSQPPGLSSPSESFGPARMSSVQWPDIDVRQRQSSPSC